MIALSNNVLGLCGAVLAIIFVWSFVRAKVWAELNTKNIAASFRPFLYLLLPLLALSALGAAFKIFTAECVGFLALGAAVPFILSQINLPVFYRSIILLALSVALCQFVNPEYAADAVAATLTGLLSWKGVENLLRRPQCTFEDILPAFVFLSGAFWFKVGGATGDQVRNLSLVLASLVIGLFLRWSERPLVGNDPYWWRRILIAASGGLFLLIFINKILVAPKIATIAALAGAAYFVAYLFEWLTHVDGERSEMLKGFKSLVFVGIFTLLATRLFGMLGVLVVAAGATVARRHGIAQTVGIFLGARVLLQGFIAEYNPNVTGINIMHAYSYAAMFAGMLSMFVVSSLFKENDFRKYLPFALVGSGVALPVVSNYFLHAEPSGALIASALVAAVLLALFLTQAYDLKLPEHENIILAPPLMISVAYLAGELITLGNDAPSALKTQVIAGLLVVATITCIVTHLITGKNPPAVTAEPEPTAE